MRPNIHAGMQLPQFVEGGPPATDPDVMNAIVAVMNALLNLKVVRGVAQAGADGGTPVPGAEWHVSEQNTVLELLD